MRLVSSRPTYSARSPARPIPKSVSPSRGAVRSAAASVRSPRRRFTYRPKGRWGSRRGVGASATAFPSPPPITRASPNMSRRACRFRPIWSGASFDGSTAPRSTSWLRRARSWPNSRRKVSTGQCFGSAASTSACSGLTVRRIHRSPGCHARSSSISGASRSRRISRRFSTPRSRAPRSSSATAPRSPNCARAIPRSISSANKRAKRSPLPMPTPTSLFSRAAPTLSGSSSSRR